jgi:hypothetical protein
MGGLLASIISLPNSSVSIPFLLTTAFFPNPNTCLYKFIRNLFLFSEKQNKTWHYPEIFTFKSSYFGQ